MFVRTLSALACVAFAAPAWAQEKKQERNQERNQERKQGDAAPLEGTFIATAGARDGKPLTEEQIRGLTFRFDADKLVITDRSGKELHKCTHTIDKSANPWKIDMKMDGSTAGDKRAVGLIHVDGDTVSFIYPLAGGETPTEFKTKEKQEMYVLKRQK